MPGGGLGNSADVVGRGAAAATDDVHKAVLQKAFNYGGHLLRRLVVFAKFVGQARIRVGGREKRRFLGQCLHVRPHQVGSQSAIQANRKQRQMRNRSQERFGCLPGKRAPRRIGDGAGNHDRDFGLRISDCRIGGFTISRDTIFSFNAAFRVELVNREQGGFGVERVENRFHQQNVRAAVHEAAHLFIICIHEFVKRDGAVAGVVHIRRKRGGAVGGAHGTGHETGFIRVLARKLHGHLLRNPCRFVVQFVHQMLHVVIGHGDGRARKRVGFQNVGSGFEVLRVDFADNLRLRERQQVVVALQIVRKILEPFAPVVFFRQVVTLDHGSHRAVEHEDAVFENFADVSHVLLVYCSYVCSLLLFRFSGSGFRQKNHLVLMGNDEIMLNRSGNDSEPVRFKIIFQFF